MPSVPRPVETVEWATGPSATLSPPSTEKREVGFDRKGEKPPRGLFNFFFHFLWSWIDHLRSTVDEERVRLYPDIPTFIADPLAPVGSVAVIEDTQTSFEVAWSQELIPRATHEGFVSAIAATDEYVMAYAVSTVGAPSIAELRVFNAATGVEESYSPLSPDSGTVLDICSDGRYFYTLEGSGLVRKYDPVDGSIVASVTPGGSHTNQRIGSDGDQVFIARRNVAAAPSFVIAIPADLSTSTPNWQVDANENQRDWAGLAVGSEWIYITSDNDTSDRIWIARKTDGANFNDIGPDGESRGIATDGVEVIVGSDLQVYRAGMLVRNPDYGQEYVSAFATGSRDIAVNKDFFVAALTNSAADSGGFGIIDKQSGAPSAYIDGGQGLTSSEVARAVATNHRHAFIGGQTIIDTLIEGGPVNWTLRAIRLPTGPTLYRRTSETDPGRRWPGSLLEPQT